MRTKECQVLMQLPQTVINLLTCLNDGQWHSGNQLSLKLGVSRSAVWKHIQTLETLGLVLFAKQGKGYQLQEETVLLNGDAISAQLDDSLVKSIRFHILSRVSSTNTYLKNLPHQDGGMDVCLAESQTEGRGRFSRHWHSPFAKNIYCSIRWHYHGNISALSGLSLAVSLAITQALENYGIDSKHLKIKWPNDVLYQGKKLSGSLIELIGEFNDSCVVIIGIGINVNMIEASLQNQWRSLRHITGTLHDRNIIIRFLLQALYKALALYKDEGLLGFEADWQKKDCLINQQLSLKQGEQIHQGLGRGIDSKGNLIIKLTDGSLRHFSSGDTTLHPIFRS